MSRGFAWIDESIEHSDVEQDRAAALARRWSIAHDRQEQDRWKRQADVEDGRVYDPDPDWCHVCDGIGELGLVVIRNGRHLERPEWAVGIRCPAPNCEDGLDLTPIIEHERRETARIEDLRLEVEIVERMLAELGARIMRPYEHWNEEERYREWMECGRFGESAD